MPFCPQCGARNVDEARFCNACGGPMPVMAGAGAPAQQAAPPPPAPPPAAPPPVVQP
ncbi:MAG: zinc-ribbon domain-containing protein, partial [Acidobacteriota bacterium]